jgi:hypothetical protein
MNRHRAVESPHFPSDVSALQSAGIRADKKKDPDIPGGVSVRRSTETSSAVIAALVLCSTAMVSAENPQKTFEKTWVGRHVLVRQSLYSLVYNERARGGVKARRDGLTVVSPFTGIHFQFDGRKHVENVSEQNVQKIVASVKLAYQKEKMLEGGVDQVIDPVMLTRYEPGTQLIVRAARVDLSSVRIELSMPGETDTDPATSLTVQWPAPLSKSFSERVDVEGLIQQFLAIQQ